MQMLEINQNKLVPLHDDWAQVDVAALLAGTDDQVIGATHALIIDNDIDLTLLTPEILKAGAIIVNFPKFADGRAYSQARQLRERFGFAGVIIARGEVLADQVLLMRRCGINAIEIAADDLTVFETALRAFSHVYQPSADGYLPVWALRAKRRRVAA